MKKLTAIAALGGLSFALAACGSADDASTEAMPDSVEMPADDALGVVVDEPVEDEDVVGPEIDPAENAPDQATTEAAASDAASAAADAQAALEALDATDVIDAAADAATDAVSDD